jgi:hypothetical protein
MPDRAEPEFPEANPVFPQKGDHMRIRKVSKGVLGAAIMMGILALPAMVSADVDLHLVSVNVSYDGNDLHISAEVGASYHGSHGPFATDVRFYLDTDRVFTDPFDGPDYPIETCEDSAPACDGICVPMIINGTVTSGSCVNWLYPNGCSCIYLVLSNEGVQPYGGQATCTAVVDEDNNVQEADETNNSMTVDLQPIAVDMSTWTAIKVLYR